ncbi:MAG: hypothetical protein KKC55_15145 [Gammaproteobacteria bacterium]|uniref:Uncharacterized protein n=1 Tax=viral metagenome TaxID=1070528 RepID=A0A6M3M631_9ZZZZ|nr:hypothetical protein [Gammaproteobacteria bacterium]
MKEKPVAIRIEVPEKFGPAYDSEDGRQWVERRQRVSGAVLKKLIEVTKNILSDEKAFAEVAKVLAKVFPAWNLEGDDGPLPQPWENAKAFHALFESDYRLMDWVGSLPFSTVGELLDLKN